MKLICDKGSIVGIKKQKETCKLFNVGARVIMNGRLGTITTVHENNISFPYEVKFDDSNYEVCPLVNQLRLI